MSKFSQAYSFINRYDRASQICWVGEDSIYILIAHSGTGPAHAKNIKLYYNHFNDIYLTIWYIYL